MPNRHMLNFLRYLCIITLLEQVVSISQLRSIWTWNAPHVNDIYSIIGYDDDLRILTRMAIGTFEYIHDKVHISITWSRKWFEECGDFNPNHDYDGKYQPCVLSVKDRLLRCFMFYTNHSIAALEHTFGQKKSVIYTDVKFIMQQIVYKLGREWLSLPDAESNAYNTLIGQGVFSEGGQTVFDNTPYVCDVTSIRTCRPRLGQRSYYNGHKKYHTVDFQCVHSGTGRVYSCCGPIPGSHNDVQTAKASIIYTNTDRYIAPGHKVLADLAYYHIGEPYLCRISFQSSYTPLENHYNILHSRCRVISENYYGRFKTYWSYLNKPWQQKLDDIDFAVRGLLIITNIIITIQDPLRNWD